MRLAVETFLGGISQARSRERVGLETRKPEDRHSSRHTPSQPGGNLKPGLSRRAQPPENSVWRWTALTRLPRRRPGWSQDHIVQYQDDPDPRRWSARNRKNRHRLLASLSRRTSWRPGERAARLSHSCSYHATTRASTMAITPFSSNAFRSLVAETASQADPRTESDPWHRSS
jgi:hypothetical protein